MLRFRTMATTSMAIAALLGSLLHIHPARAADAPTPALSPAQEGRQIAFDRTKGNCLACHLIDGGETPGNIAPALIAMAARYPDKARLRAQIWDATVANPATSMPPFGRHRILTEAEIDKVVEFVHAL